MNPNFLPTEFVIPLKWEESRQIIVDRETQTADVVNSMDQGFYDEIEILNGQQFFSSVNQQNPKLAFRKVLDFGVLPNSGAKIVPHGITGITAMTRLYAVASSPSAYIPIPYFSLASGIELSADTTNVTITTSTNRTAFTTCFVVLEYLKN